MNGQGVHQKCGTDQPKENSGDTGLDLMHGHRFLLAIDGKSLHCSANHMPRSDNKTHLQNEATGLEKNTACVEKMPTLQALQVLTQRHSLCHLAITSYHPALTPTKIFIQVVVETKPTVTITQASTSLHEIRQPIDTIAITTCRYPHTRQALGHSWQWCVCDSQNSCWR
jgi:hypothetical protein